MKIEGNVLKMSDGFSIDLKAVFVQNYTLDPGYRPCWEPGANFHQPGARLASAADMAYRMARKDKLGANWLKVYIPELGDNWKQIIDFADAKGFPWAAELKNQYPVLKTNLKASLKPVKKK